MRRRSKRMRRRRVRSKRGRDASAEGARGGPGGVPPAETVMNIYDSDAQTHTKSALMFARK